MSKFTRKELKRDELAAEVSKTYEFIQQQRDKLLRIGAVVAVVAVVATAGYFFLQYRRARANEEFSRALRVFYVTTPSTQPGLTFADEKAKYTQAEKEFSAVASKYSWLDKGKLARYYLGITKRELGKTDEAVRDLRDVAGSGDDEAAALAKFALAETLARTGKIADAEKLYRELADKRGDAVSREAALLALATHLESSKPAEAQKIYEELKKNENTAARDLADRRLAELKKK